MKRIIFILIAIFLCIIAVQVYLLLKPKSTTSTAIPKKPVSTQTFPPGSPEVITQTYYFSYEACLKQHKDDLHNGPQLHKDCPIHAFTGMAKTFVQKNQVAYGDQILCDEGIPDKMIIGKAYIGTDKVATVNVTTVFKEPQLTIPVRLHKESGIWKI